MWVWTEKAEAIKALEAICEGYPQKPSDGYIVVENPDFQEDNGTNPNLVIDVADLIHYLENNP